MQRKLKITALFVILISMTMLPLSVYADGGEKEIVVSATIPSITAKSVLVMDANTGQVLFENSSSEKLAVSHITKLMTLLLTVEALESKKLTLETKLKTSKHANSMGDPQIWLNVGEDISVDELIKSITIGNANDACVVLAEALGNTEESFVDKMNKRASELGMNNTMFINSTGNDADGQYSTAYDVALLAKEVSKHEELVPYMTSWMADVRNGQTNLVNSNILVKNLNGITGMKACFSKQAGNCIVLSVKRNNLSLIFVMLGCSNAEKRFDDAKSLVTYAFAANEYFNPSIKPEDMKSIKVNGGQKSNVSITCESKDGIVIPRGTSKNMRMDIVLSESIDAPVSKGQIVGEVLYYDNDRLVYKKNIVTTEKVDKTSIMFCFNKLLGYFLKM